ncbi:MAG: FkbM family methyltransferase [Chloroflexota bacterium]
MSKQHSKHSPRAEYNPPPAMLINGYVSIKNCRHGLFMYNVNDLFVGHGMDIYGEWCDAELESLGQIIRSGDVVIDVGSNIGTHAVFFAQKVNPGGMVYAFEPQRVTFEYLCANLALNGLLNVVPVQAGVGDRHAEVNIPVLDPTVLQNFGCLNIEGHAVGDLVKILPLDSLGLKRCNLIKIDVEGMESQVLRGAEQTIRNCKPFLFVENNSREGSPELVKQVMELDYKCWWHIAPYYNSDNYFKNPKNEWANIVPEANMICVPNDSPLNVTGFEPLLDAADTWVQALGRINSK